MIPIQIYVSTNQQQNPWSDNISVWTNTTSALLKSSALIPSSVGFSKGTSWCPQLLLESVSRKSNTKHSHQNTQVISSFKVSPKILPYEDSIQESHAA